MRWFCVLLICLPAPASSPMVTACRLLCTCSCYSSASRVQSHPPLRASPRHSQPPRQLRPLQGQVPLLWCCWMRLDLLRYHHTTPSRLVRSVGSLVWRMAPNKRLQLSGELPCCAISHRFSQALWVACHVVNLEACCFTCMSFCVAAIRVTLVGQHPYLCLHAHPSAFPGPPR